MTSVEQNSTNSIKFAINNPDWAYLHLELLTDIPNPSLDLITWRLSISRILNQFLGISGDSIPIDLLHFSDNQLYIRVPASDLQSVWNALSGAVTSVNGQPAQGSISVVRASRYLSALVAPRRGKWT